MPDYHLEVRESIWYYIIDNNWVFANHLPQEINMYIQNMLEDEILIGEHETILFTELYNARVIAYYTMTKSIPQFIAENEE